MSPGKTVMLLIDADNVSVGVMEQAVERLLAEHGALHVRRAYGTADSAAKHQAVFKRLGIRPMVNLAAGKNSTDIAMAIDAIDLAIAERPDVVVIASSDSDFAPLVTRLREKGCRVCGIGQAGKTGEETIAVYDEYVVLPHRLPRAPSRAATVRAAVDDPPAPAAQRSARKSTGRRTKASDAGSVSAAVAAPAAPGPAVAPAPAAAAAVAAEVPARRPAARKAAPRRRAAAADAPASASASATAPTPLPDQARAILAALPELARGGTLELNRAAERLREARLLSRSGSSTKLFGLFPTLFDLSPLRQPSKVRVHPGALE